ncbi:MAG: hypothetical protein LW863_11060, partial [Flammeovirgaceae bacterium]|nr:hypothetical protein [Flammeovirgaceae bacterium]
MLTTKNIQPCFPLVNLLCRTAPTESLFGLGVMDERRQESMLQQTVSPNPMDKRWKSHPHRYYGLLVVPLLSRDGTDLVNKN